MNDVKGFKFFGFDLDNTLFDQNDYNIKVIKEFSKLLSIQESNLIEAYMKSRNSRDFIRSTLEGSQVYSEENHNLFFEIYRTLNCSISLFEPARIVLSKLKEIKNIKLFLITNGVVEVQKNKVKCLDIEKYMDLIVYARMWGPDNEKPNLKPFEFAFQNLGGTPDEYIMFGDSVVNDIGPALRMGWSAQIVDFEFDFDKYIFA